MTMLIKSLFWSPLLEPSYLDDRGDRACLEIQKLTILCFVGNVFVAARDDTIRSTVSLCVGQCC